MRQILSGNNHSSGSGFIFLEILIAVSLTSIVFVTLVVMGALSISLSSSIQKTAEADSLLREEMEAIRTFRDGTSWAAGIANLSTGSANPYYAWLDTSSNPGQWKLSAGTQTAGNFTRNVIFDKVSRDPSNQNIETNYNAAHDDPDTRKVTATATFSGKTYQISAYLTNWQK